MCCVQKVNMSLIHQLISLTSKAALIYIFCNGAKNQNVTIIKFYTFAPFLATILVLSTTV